MSEQVLSSEEVDAILKVTQDSNSLNVSFDNATTDEEKNRNSNTLTNLGDITRFEYEKILSSFLLFSVKKSLLK
jgi:hypothetical protein